jgi:hypothetical protein
MLAKLYDNSGNGLGLKNWLGLASDNTENDDLLTGLLQALSTEFASACSRTLEYEQRTQVFDGGENTIVVDLYPIIKSSFIAKESFDAEFDQVEALVIDSDYFVYEKSGMIKRASGVRWLSGEQTVQFTWSGGYVDPANTPTTGQSVMPKDIQFAVLEQARFLWKQKDQIGIISQGMGGGSWTNVVDGEWLPRVQKVINRYKKY